MENNQHPNQETNQNQGKMPERNGEFYLNQNEKQGQDKTQRDSRQDLEKQKVREESHDDKTNKNIQ